MARPERRPEPPKPPEPKPVDPRDAEPTEEQVLDAAPAVDWGGDPSRLSG